MGEEEMGRRKKMKGVGKREEGDERIAERMIWKRKEGSVKGWEAERVKK